MNKIDSITTALADYLEDIEYCFQNGDKIRGLPTGLQKLDQKLNGLRGGEVILVGGRPAMGKTAFALNCIYHTATKFANEAAQNPDELKHVLYFSCGQSNKRIAQRFISLVSGIPSHTHVENSENFAQIAAAVKEIDNLPIYLCNQLHEPENIQKNIYRFAQKKQLGLMVIDYLQGLSVFEPEDEKRELFYRHFMQDIKSIAEKLDIPIIVLSQLNQNLEQRQDKWPILSDIRGGARNIVPYVDKILLIYRLHYYIWWHEPQRHKRETQKHFQQRYKDWKQECSDSENKCTIIVAKNNDGSCACVDCMFDTSTGKFADLAEEEFFRTT